MQSLSTNNFHSSVLPEFFMSFKSFQLMAVAVYFCLMAKIWNHAISFGGTIFQAFSNSTSTVLFEDFSFHMAFVLFRFLHVLDMLEFFDNDGCVWVDVLVVWAVIWFATTLIMTTGSILFFKNKKVVCCFFCSNDDDYLFPKMIKTHVNKMIDLPVFFLLLLVT